MQIHSSTFPFHARSTTTRQMAAMAGASCGGTLMSTSIYTAKFPVKWRAACGGDQQLWSTPAGEHDTTARDTEVTQ